jgi:hypothetical protein
MCDQADEYDDETCEDVDDVVICGHDDRGRHRCGAEHGERPRCDVPRRAPDRNACEEVPAEVQAGEGRVLVGEPGRLEHPVSVRVESDGVDESRVDEPWRRDGEEREEEKSDSTGDEDRVPQQPVALAAMQEEDDPDRDDDGPVAPDINPVS